MRVREKAAHIVAFAPVEEDFSATDQTANGMFIVFCR
jgi:hypothetical protein